MNKEFSTLLQTVSPVAALAGSDKIEKMFGNKEEDPAQKVLKDAAEQKAAQDQAGQIRMQKSNSPTGMKSGGKVGSASSRADGIAQRGKTRGTMVACGGGMMKK